MENADEIVAGQLRTIFFMPLFREVAEKDEQVWQYPLWNFKLEGYKTRHRYKISKCSNSFPILCTDFWGKGGYLDFWQKNIRLKGKFLYLLKCIDWKV